MKYIPYVNIKMGTRSHMKYSTGNTLPLTQIPFGMASFCPQTEVIKGREGWFFNPDLPVVEGIRLTHQPSPWIRDYGAFLFTPQNDIVSDTSELASSGYRIKDAVMRPDYLKIRFLRSLCDFELTPTERGCAFRLSFDTDRESFVSLLPVMGNYTYHYDEKNDILFGSTDGHSQDEARDFKTYVAVKLLDGCVDKGRIICNGEGESKCAHIGIKGKVVEGRVAISYISEEMALYTLERECKDKSFEELRQEAEDNWEEKLHRIEVVCEDEKRLSTFYSCMYRVFLFPHKAYEIDKNGEKVHYTPKTGKESYGVRYTDTGFWDTSRTLFPLYSIIARDEYADMLRGFVNDYLECGWLPRWPSIGEVGCMPSTLIDCTIADAVVKGIGSRELWENALKGMLHHANNESEDRRYGRNGAIAYKKYGYVPKNLQKESVNLTLDASYGDWCIATVSRELGYDSIYNEYIKRADNYKNLFDPVSGFMRGRYENGKMSEDFDPCIWGGDYTEGSAWQNSFWVPHDIEGLCDLYGGREKLIEKLDELFSELPKYRVHGYGGEIHEMTEMAAVDYGQCAISNQPSFHIPYLYGYLGETKKCRDVVKKMCEELFSAEGGFPGDEDNGSMSAWYIFSCLGMYPICPGKDEYVHMEPLFDEININGKPFYKKGE
ncbi:MAG: GH92 family glycosyl hydrolase [Clostridia bacterium]|nr:GH92 family glycosyl hydrolase [Clostridia bacterium]